MDPTTNDSINIPHQAQQEQQEQQAQQEEQGEQAQQEQQEQQVEPQNTSQAGDLPQHVSVAGNVLEVDVRFTNFYRYCFATKTDFSAV